MPGNKMSKSPGVACLNSFTPELAAAHKFLPSLSSGLWSPSLVIRHLPHTWTVSCSGQQPGHSFVAAKPPEDVTVLPFPTVSQPVLGQLWGPLGVGEEHWVGCQKDMDSGLGSKPSGLCGQEHVISTPVISSLEHVHKTISPLRG